MTSAASPSSSIRLTEVGDLAEYISYEYYGLPPVNPQAIARAKGITTSFGSYGDTFDGLIEFLGGRFHIYCNLDRVDHPQSPRARFTVAHELGHFFIDAHRHVLESGGAKPHQSYCEFESRNPAEREADHFASRLLMPARAFTARAAAMPLGLGGILQLKDEFQTSVTSTAIRYTQCDLLPCTVVKWFPDGYGWKWLSTATFRSHYRRTIECLDDVPPDSATGEALSGGEPPPQGYFERGTTYAAWFPSVREDSSRNHILIEQAVPLGQFGVLTFLFPESSKGRSAN